MANESNRENEKLQQRFLLHFRNACKLLRQWQLRFHHHVPRLFRFLRDRYGSKLVSKTILVNWHLRSR